MDAKQEIIEIMAGFAGITPEEAEIMRVALDNVRQRNNGHGYGSVTLRVKDGKIVAISEQHDMKPCFESKR